MIRKIFHFLSLLLLVLINIWDRINNMPKYPYSFLYLTQINLYLNTLFYLISFILDYYSQQHRHYLDKSYNFLFGMSFRVCIMYWMFIIIDKRALFKAGTAFSISSFALSLLLHGGVFAICLLDQFFGNIRHRPQYINPIIFAVVYLVYFYSLRQLYNYYGIKVYPYVYKSSLLKLTLISLLGFVISLLGHYLLVWLSTRNKPIKDQQEEELITKDSKQHHTDNEIDS